MGNLYLTKATHINRHLHSIQHAQGHLLSLTITNAVSAFQRGPHISLCRKNSFLITASSLLHGNLIHMNIHELEYTSDSQQPVCFDLGIHAQNVNKSNEFGCTVKRGLLIAADPCQLRPRDPLVLALLAVNLSGDISILL